MCGGSQHLCRGSVRTAVTYIAVIGFGVCAYFLCCDIRGRAQKDINMCKEDDTAHNIPCSCSRFRRDSFAGNTKQLLVVIGSRASLYGGPALRASFLVALIERRVGLGICLKG